MFNGASCKFLKSQIFKEKFIESADALYESAILEKDKLSQANENDPLLRRWLTIRKILMYSEGVREPSFRDVLDRAGRGGGGVAMQSCSDGQAGLGILDRRTSCGGTSDVLMITC